MTSRPDFALAASTFARRIRIDERRAVCEVFRSFLLSQEFRHRHVDDAAEEIIDAVQAFYERHESPSSRADA